MNKKIKNATPTEYKGIKFKSILEKRSFEILDTEGFNPGYEKFSVTLQESFRGTVPYYDRYYNRKLRKNVWGESIYKVQDIKYTPDIDFIYNGYHIVIELKGFENDVSPMKMKLFRKYIEDHKEEKIRFFEVYALKDLKKAIEIIKSLT
jgi:hypothetical protein